MGIDLVVLWGFGLGAPLGLMIYATFTDDDKAYARRLERKSLPTSVPQTLTEPNEPAGTDRERLCSYSRTGCSE